MDGVAFLGGEVDRAGSLRRAVDDEPVFVSVPGADAGFAYHRVVGVVGAADRGCESPVFGILRPLDGCLPGAVGTFVFDRRVLEVFRGDHTRERRGVRPEVRVVVVGRARGDRRGDGLGVLQGDRGLLPCVVRDGEPEVGV